VPTAGTSYIRWGRKTCESSASLVYTGDTLLIKRSISIFLRLINGMRNRTHCNVT